MPVDRASSIIANHNVSNSMLVTLTAVDIAAHLPEGENKTKNTNSGKKAANTLEGAPHNLCHAVDT